MIPTYKFQARANQDAFVMRPELRLLCIDFVEQFPNSRSLPKLKLQLVNSDEFTQLRMELHADFHCFVSPNIVHTKSRKITMFPNVASQIETFYQIAE